MKAVPLIALCSLLTIAASPPLPYPPGTGGGGDPTMGHPEDTHGPAPVIYRPQVSLLTGQLTDSAVLVPPIEGIRLEWSTPLIPVDFYQIHQGPASGGYTNIIEIPGSLQTVAFIGLDEGIRNYFRVNAFTLGMNGQGVVSQFSNEAVYDPAAVEPPPEPERVYQLFPQFNYDVLGSWSDIPNTFIMWTNTLTNNAFFRLRISTNPVIIVP